MDGRPREHRSKGAKGQANPPAGCTQNSGSPLPSARSVRRRSRLRSISDADSSRCAASSATVGRAISVPTPDAHRQVVLTSPPPVAMARSESPPTEIEETLFGIDCLRRRVPAQKTWHSCLFHLVRLSRCSAAARAGGAGNAPRSSFPLGVSGIESTTNDVRRNQVCRYRVPATQLADRLNRHRVLR